MSLRVCSNLSTLILALALACPALADEPKKKRGSKKAESAEAKPADEAPAADAEAPPAQDVEPMPDDKTWEQPPADEEKPVAPKAAPKKVVVGDGKPLSVALTLGYGFMTDRRVKQVVGADPNTFAAGLRGGYSLDMQIYLGLYFNYYLGSSKSGASAGSGRMSSVAASSMHFGAEVGYDAWIGPAVIRPSLQIGPAIVLTNQSGPTTTVNVLMFGPGLTIFAPVDDFFIGGDFRFNLLTGDAPGSILLAAIGGARF